MLDDYHKDNPLTEFKRRGKVQAMEKMEETD